METEMLSSAMRNQTGETEVARMAQAFGELAETPKLSLLHRYESRLHLMYQRGLRSLIALRQAEIPNEPTNILIPNEDPDSAGTPPDPVEQDPPAPAGLNSPAPDPDPEEIPSDDPRAQALSPRVEDTLHAREDDLGKNGPEEEWPAESLERGCRDIGRLRKWTSTPAGPQSNPRASLARHRADRSSPRCARQGGHLRPSGRIVFDSRSGVRYSR